MEQKNQEKQEDVRGEASEEAKADTITKEEVNAENEEESRFKEGQKLTFVRVRFPGNAKSFPFLINRKNKRFSYGQKVLAMSDRGVTVGYINSFPYEIPFKKSMMPIRSINKIATDKDVQKQSQHFEKEKEAENLCLSLIEHYKLNMNLTHVEIIQFGKKAVFYFNAPERVDFRDLVKDLVSKLKMRIELRQISVRDRTAALGAISACGRQNCCSSFLKNYGAANIKMAKNQSLALIPNKINGVCGQTKCCLRFEDDVYSEKRGRLPRENSFIKARNGDMGKVTRLHLLQEEFEMITDTGKRRRYDASQFLRKEKLPREWKFPTSFEHIVDESKDTIGKESTSTRAGSFPSTPVNPTVGSDGQNTKPAPSEQGRNRPKNKRRYHGRKKRNGSGQKS